MSPTEHFPTDQLWLVRHGETEWSATHRHTSHTDVELTDTGRRHAAALAERLRGHAFSRVLVSPRRRARVTCELAGLGDRAEVLEDLVEWDYGQDEGRTTIEIRVERPGWSIWGDGPLGGENTEDVRRRADAVVAHGHISRVLGARWIGLEVATGAHLRLSTASVSVLGYERETPVLQLWNDTGHLTP